MKLKELSMEGAIAEFCEDDIEADTEKKRHLECAAQIIAAGLKQAAERNDKTV